MELQVLECIYGLLVASKLYDRRLITQKSYDEYLKEHYETVAKYYDFINFINSNEED